MKLLALEASQNSYYYLSRYQQLAGMGVDLYVLNGIGTDDFWPADRYRRAGSKHIDDLVRQAMQWHAEERFEGVLSFSESAVIAVATVASALGLPSIGAYAALTSRNKLIMRTAHRHGGVPIPSFRLVPDVDAALAAAADFGYPVILKPTLGAASNYVFRIDDPEQMRVRYEQALAGLAKMSWYAMEAEGLDLGPHGLLVESFLDGHEHLIEALVWDDEVFLGSIVDRITVEGDTFEDDVHHAPTILTPEQVAAVHEVVAAGVRAQGLHRSAMHAEVRFHQGKPFLLEIAARPGGGGLDIMARLSADYDPIMAVRDVARGVRPRVHHFSPTSVHTAALCLLSGGGVIESVDVPPDVAGAPEVFYLKITARPGDIIRRPPDGNNVLGGIGTTGASLEEALETAERLAGKITARMVGDD
jgi:biotin carboxylase